MLAITIAERQAKVRRSFLRHLQSLVGPSSSGLERLNHCFGLLLCDSQECLGRTIWFPPSLFPILKRGFAYTDHHGELTLRNAKLSSNTFYVHGTELEHAGGLEQAFTDLARLLNVLG